LEWIQTGLRKYGVSVHIPPSVADVEPLLALLGDKSTNATEQIPYYVKYKAYRWLRDSDFQAIPFALSNVTAQTSALVREGLVEFGKRESWWPRSEAIGRLALGTPAPDVSSLVRPSFYQPRFQIAGYSLMILPLLAGTALLVYSRRQRKRGESVAPVHGGDARPWG
jgi:hypothetical protein